MDYLKQPPGILTTNYQEWRALNDSTDISIRAAGGRSPDQNHDER
jgi:hypothetical protein